MELFFILRHYKRTVNADEHANEINKKLGTGLFVKVKKQSDPCGSLKAVLVYFDAEHTFYLVVDF